MFYAYRQIKENKDLQKDAGKCVYIVDKDWDLTLRSTNKWVNKKDEPFITMTKGHSMECYFLEKENVQRIFEHYSLTDKIAEFADFERKFVDLSLEYWALKSTVQYAMKTNVRCRYRKKHSFNEIFAFDFSKEPFFKRQLMDEEICIMKEAIKDNEQLERYCSIWKEKIKNEPRYIRGHDYFNFLQMYLEFVLSRKVTENELFELVYNMNVDIDIKRSVS